MWNSCSVGWVYLTVHRVTALLALHNMNSDCGLQTFFPRAILVYPSAVRWAPTWRNEEPDPGRRHDHRRPVTWTWGTYSTHAPGIEMSLSLEHEIHSRKFKVVCDIFRQKVRLQWLFIWKCMFYETNTLGLRTFGQDVWSRAILRDNQFAYPFCWMFLNLRVCAVWCTKTSGVSFWFLYVVLDER